MRFTERLVFIGMGVMLSFCLSLTGTLTSGHFAVASLLQSFGLSLIVSLIFSLLLPFESIYDMVHERFNADNLAMARYIVVSCIIVIIYVPSITFLMIVFAYFRISAYSPDRNLSLSTMYLSMLCPCLLIGFVIVLLFLPIYTKLKEKK